MIAGRVKPQATASPVKHNACTFFAEQAALEVRRRVAPRRRFGQEFDRSGFMAALEQLPGVLIMPLRQWVVDFAHVVPRR
jgi:hypothetical protein